MSTFFCVIDTSNHATADSKQLTVRHQTDARQAEPNTCRFNPPEAFLPLFIPLNPGTGAHCLQGIHKLLF